MSEPTSRELLKQFIEGQDSAADAIVDRYIERLLALARTRMSSKLRRRIDPEDVVQSAYRSFFLHAELGEYQLNRSGDLWRLLAKTTLHKLYGAIEKQTAAKRHLDKEAQNHDGLAQLASREPTAADVIAVSEQLSLIMSGLSLDQRAALTATLQGREIDEIATDLGKSERTIRRLVATAKQQFEQRLLGNNDQATSVPSDEVVEPPTTLDYADYRLEELLGSGGMGKVYRASEKKTGATVAIKALHKSRQQEPRAVAQFVRESQILTQLDHPNIVSVQGLGKFPGGGFFLVMEFIDGLDLQTRLQDGPLPASRVVSIALIVASAVQHAHEHGIVHCDLKPANVLLGSDGRIFVTDFGFAYILTDKERAKHQAVGGTPGFIPPELLAMESQPTPAGDIYGLGALMWTLLNGRPPGNDAPTLPNIDIPPDLLKICRRCLAENPRERYAAMSDVIADIDNFRLK